MANDFYQTLGISRSADEKAIRSAYRKLARKYHPDLNPGDSAAERKFKEINEANGVLSDPAKRAKYDKHGDQWMNADRIEAQQARARAQSRPGARRQTSGRTPPTGGGFPNGGTSVEYGFGDLGDLDDIFGGLGDMFDSTRGYRSYDTNTTTRRSAAGRRSRDIPVTISLEEAFTGTKRLVNVPAKDNAARRIEVRIPPAVDDGARVHVGLPDGAQVFLAVTIAPHANFKRDGDDLHADLAVPFEDTLLGGEVEFTSLKGRLALKVPPNSAEGKRIRIQKHGMPKSGDPSTNGDLYVTIKPKLPDSLQPDEAEALKEYRKRRITNRMRA